MIKNLSTLLFAGFFLASCQNTTPTETSTDTQPPITTSENQPSSTDEHAGHTMEETAVDSDRLNNSPRHQEWVEVKNGEKNIHTWVVYPESSEKAPVVLLIHENRGLNDWARTMADEIAEAGYIAVAPDLLSDFSSTEKQTSDFANEDAAIKAIGTLESKNVMSDLKAVIDWTKTIPSSNGKIASAGFCWGGSQAFQFATESKDLAFSMVFYGTGPTEPSAYEKISAPIYGFYGGADERVDATIPQSEEFMKKAGKTYDYKIYEGAGHAFMRSGEDPNGETANIAARNKGWERMKELLETL